MKMRNFKFLMFIAKLLECECRTISGNAGTCIGRTQACTQGLSPLFKLSALQQRHHIHEGLAIKGGKEAETVQDEDQATGQLMKMADTWYSFFLELWDSVLQFMKGSFPALTESAQERFEKEFGKSHPSFFNGSFMQAADSCRRKGKFALVLLRPSNPKGKKKKQDQRICSALTEKKVVRFIQRNYIFWSAHQATSQVTKITPILGKFTYPVLCIVHADTSTKSNRVIARHHLNPAPSSSQMLSWLNHTAIHNEGLLIEDKRAQEKIKKEVRLMNEQRLAYEASLRLDMENEQKEQERQAQEAAEKAAEEERQEEAKKQALAIAERRAAKSKQLGAEPSGEENNSVITVMFRFPDGHRASRRFLCESTMEQIFDWADVLEVDIEESKLTLAFPKRSFVLPDDKDVKLSAIGTYKSFAFLIEKRRKDQSEDRSST